MRPFLTLFRLPQNIQATTEHAAMPYPDKLNYSQGQLYLVTALCKTPAVTTISSTLILFNSPAHTHLPPGLPHELYAYSKYPYHTHRGVRQAAVHTMICSSGGREFPRCYSYCGRWGNH